MVVNVSGEIDCQSEMSCCTLTLKFFNCSFIYIFYSFVMKLYFCNHLEVDILGR